MKFRTTFFIILWALITVIMAILTFEYRDNIKQKYAQTYNSFSNIKNTGMVVQAREVIDNGSFKVKEFSDKIKEKTFNYIALHLDNLLDVSEEDTKYHSAIDIPNGFINASYDIDNPPPRLTLSEISRRNKEDEDARLYANIMPAASLGPPMWTPEQPELEVEAVLVPRQITVISSSQDGRIASIPVNHGDAFKKGDLLIAYDCSNIRAEAEIAKIEKDFMQNRLKGSDNLFKLDIISDIDRASAQIENDKASIKGDLYETRLKDCDIRAEFDGVVTNRLGNPGEYTRTDRVLLEVASKEPLQAEFLVPSKWLRWVNIGAPISIFINENEKIYSAKIKRIHGEIDPVSQSIQMVASLDEYQDPLIPGMSGKITININSIRDAGVAGYLEVTKNSGAN